MSKKKKDDVQTKVNEDVLNILVEEGEVENVSDANTEAEQE